MWRQMRRGGSKSDASKTRYRACHFARPHMTIDNLAPAKVCST
jgi:hypothetical protein